MYSFFKALIKLPLGFGHDIVVQALASFEVNGVAVTCKHMERTYPEKRGLLIADSAL